MGGVPIIVTIAESKSDGSRLGIYGCIYRLKNKESVVRWVAGYFLIVVCHRVVGCYYRCYSFYGRRY